MENQTNVISGGHHRAWRRVAKKERRRRLRIKAAKEREEDEARLKAALERSVEYLTWLEEEEKLKKEKEAKEKEEHDEREKQWLEEEVRAQKEWRIIQEKKARARQQQLEQEEKVRQEFEARQELLRKREEESKRLRDEEIKRREQLQKEIDDYIDNGIKTPEALREVVDSQPGKELCPFFAKTGACRYGDTCSRNHRRLCLSNVILIPNFYSHFSLQKNSAEYDTDVALEFENSETRKHFREFYNDVVPELETFGRIRTLKCCCNTEIHLRGNLYVEYYSEQEAARAARKLKGRWYAGRQLNCEFTNLKSWRSAVCGMQKCPKGRACNFLHVFRNPHNEYDIKSPPRWAKETVVSESNGKKGRSMWEESTRENESRNWRWSESPEVELDKRDRNAEKNDRQFRYSEHNTSSRSEKRKNSTDRSKDRNGRRSKQSKENRHSHSRSHRKHKNRRERNDDSSYEEEDKILKDSESEERHQQKRKRKGSREQVDIKYTLNTQNETEGSMLKEENEIQSNNRTSKTFKSLWDNKEPNEIESDAINSSDSDSVNNETLSMKQDVQNGSPNGWSTTDSEYEEEYRQR